MTAVLCIHELHVCLLSALALSPLPGDHPDMYTSSNTTPNLYSPVPHLCVQGTQSTCVDNETTSLATYAHTNNYIKGRVVSAVRHTIMIYVRQTTTYIHYVHHRRHMSLSVYIEEDSSCRSLSQVSLSLWRVRSHAFPS